MNSILTNGKGNQTVGQVIAYRVKKKPVLLLGIAAASVLITAQLWVFSWAPLNGRAMQVALGYFLLPLVLVVVGRLLYKDRMTWWQWIAAGVALVGVLYELFRVGGVGWETLLVALGYPIYFVLRRSMGMGHIGGMWWEFMCMAPFAVVVTVVAFALLMYLMASRLLSMSLFGLLSYLEPAMLMVASLLIGESIARTEWFTYGAIWLAVLILVAGGIAEVAQRRPR